jgi:predicted O-methyltransferase YrrM
MTLLKEIARKALPRRAFDAGKRLVLSHEARVLRDRCLAAGSIESAVDLVLASQYFCPDQRKAEITKLLELLRTQPPRLIAEIGGRIGGSLALFAHVAARDARILSIDLEYKPGQKEALGAFAREAQRITCVAADSHSPQTLAFVQDWLGGQQLDFLLIDGDHSLQGVKSDYQMYSPLVRQGGIIAFHDIVPDARTRHGIVTASDVGEVPTFWRALKGEGLIVDEFVEDWNQDGFGIGVVFWGNRKVS